MSQQRCAFDTDGDGNCCMPACPACHPENQPLATKGSRRLLEAWDAGQLGDRFGTAEARDIEAAEFDPGQRPRAGLVLTIQGRRAVINMPARAVENVPLDLLSRDLEKAAEKLLREAGGRRLAPAHSDEQEAQSDIDIRGRSPSSRLLGAAGVDSRSASGRYRRALERDSRSGLQGQNVSPRCSRGGRSSRRGGRVVARPGGGARPHVRPPCLRAGGAP